MKFIITVIVLLLNTHGEVEANTGFPGMVSGIARKVKNLVGSKFLKQRPKVVAKAYAEPVLPEFFLQPYACEACCTSAPAYVKTTGCEKICLDTQKLSKDARPVFYAESKR
jgi:hypothetical protein